MTTTPITNAAFAQQLGVILAQFNAGLISLDQAISQLATLANNWTVGAITPAQIGIQLSQTLGNWNNFISGQLDWLTVTPTGGPHGNGTVDLVDYLGTVTTIPGLQLLQQQMAKGNPVGVQFTFNNTTTSIDPGPGHFAFDNATVGAIANLYLSNTEKLGSNVAIWLSSFGTSTTIGNYGELYLSADTNMMVVTVTGVPVNNGTYTTVPVQWLGGPMPAAGAVMAFMFAPTGNRGGQMLSGHGAPAGGTGQNGDFYIDVDTGNQYGPKAAGAWGSAFSAMSSIFDLTGTRYAFGRTVAFGMVDPSMAAGLVVTTDGYLFAKHAVTVPVSNGLTFTRNTTSGFYSLQLGTIENQLPLGAAGDLIDTSIERFLPNGQPVLWALQDSAGHASVTVASDGYLRGKLGLQVSVSNGLAVTRDASGMNNLAFGSVEGQIPLGAAGGAGIIDVTANRYLGTLPVIWGIQDTSGYTSLAITADGFIRGKHAIQLGVANGLTLVRDALGMTTLSLGSTPNRLPVGAAGDSIDTTELRYYAGRPVLWAVQDASGAASLIVTADGKVYAPDLQSAATAVAGGPLDTSAALFTVAASPINGKAQIYRMDKTTLVAPAAAITAAGNNTNPVASADGSKVIYTSDRNGGRDLYYQKVDGAGAEHPYYPVGGFVMGLGDSLTAGTGSTAGNDFLSLVATASGRAANNLGIGGQTSTQIAMRYGGVACNLTVGGNQIVGGSNSVSAINGVSIVGAATGQNPDYRLLSTGADDATRNITGTLAGVHGTLQRSASGGAPSTSETYTFTPDTAPGSAVSCPVGTPFIVDTAGADDQVAFFWLGRNNYTAPTQVKADIAGCVAFFKPLAAQYVVMSVINGHYTTEYSGQSAYTTLTTLNSDLATLYPHNYVDVRAALVAAYNPANAVDVIDHGNDVPPFTLRMVQTGGTLPNPVASTDTTFTVSGLTLSVNQVITVGTEYILITGVSGSTVTTCTRGYASSTAASYSGGQTFSAADNIHLNNAGYAVVKTAVYTFAHGKGWI